MIVFGFTATHGIGVYDQLGRCQQILLWVVVQIWINEKDYIFRIHVENTCMTASIHCRAVWSHKTSLTPPLFIEEHIPSEECEQSCICVLEVSILPLFQFFCWILELLRRCVFSFFMSSSNFFHLHIGVYRLFNNISVILWLINWQSQSSSNIVEDGVTTKPLTFTWFS